MAPNSQTPLSRSILQNSGARMKPKKHCKHRISSSNKTPPAQKIEQLLALYNAAKLTEAATLARAMTQTYPHHDLAWQVLGALLIQQEQHELAVLPLKKAARLLPDEPAVFCNLGLALMKVGRLDEAEQHLRHALTLAPNHDAALNNLGLTSLKKRQPGLAESCFRQAIALQPNDAAALVNLGNAQGDLGRATDAEASYRQALNLNPNLTMALNQLAMLLAARGEQSLALKLVMRSLQIEENPTTKAYFVNIVKTLHAPHLDPSVRDIMIRVLTDPWPASIAPSVARLLQTSPDIGPAVSRAVHAWPQRLSGQDLFGPEGFPAVARDPLLHAYLVTNPALGVPLERFLTMARHDMLEIAVQNDQLTETDTDAVLNFACTLAQQCFINEYVYAQTPEETAQAAALKNELIMGMKNSQIPPLLRLMAVAAYLPLHELPNAELLLQITEPPAVVAVLNQQIREPLDERRLRDTIPCLTATDEGVSQSVRRMYEENPYPRWVKTAPLQCLSVDRFTHVTFPLASPRPLDKTNAETDILIAGCGTGRHSIDVAGRFRGARMMAIDLSLTSLSYAKRKSQEMGFNDIEYAQADILKLGTMHRRFDVIHSSGVLHHLADPWAGWRVLLSLLRPNGLMKLGFYSEIARRDIVRARAIIAERGYDSSAEGIRRCRQDLLELHKHMGLGLAVDASDFFSTSSCRDLLFHVQEHRVNLPDIATFLDRHGLRLLGFEIDKEVLDRYHQRFPDDEAATNLHNWDIFEKENPDTFSGMYQFWVQKTEV